MSGTVSMTGLVSNTNWSSLIDSMINAEKASTENPLTESKNKYQLKLTAWQSFNTKLSALTDYIYSSKLNKTEGYGVYTSSLTATDTSVTPANVLNVTVGSVSGPGKYSVEVSQLAKGEKISSDAHASSTTNLALSGDIVVNGKVVTVQAGDTLNTVASRINGVNAGVTATVLKVSDTECRLSLESTATGAAGMSLKNGGSTDILESLKLRNSTTTLAHASGSDALSDTYTDKTSAAGTLLGLTGAQSGTIKINGTDVAVNLGTDSLQTIADNINTAAPTGVTASVETVTSGSVTSYRLKLTNTAVTDLTDSNNILETLGVTKTAATNPLRSGQDASLKIDGYPITSSSNAITTAVSGLTLNLTGTNIGKPIELSINQNTTQIATNASTMVTAINNVISYINDQSTFKTTTDSTSTTTVATQNPLFADPTLALVKRNISSAVFTSVSGNSTYDTASSIGISYQKDGTLSIDSAKLSTALAANSDETVKVLKNLGDSLYSNLHGFVDPGSGTLVNATKSIQNKMTTIDTKISELEARYERERTVMETRFNALEVLISRSNTTRSWLTQQSAALTKSG